MSPMSWSNLELQKMRLLLGPWPREHNVHSALLSISLPSINLRCGGHVLWEGVGGVGSCSCLSLADMCQLGAAAASTSLVPSSPVARGLERTSRNLFLPLQGTRPLSLPPFHPPTKLLLFTSCCFLESFISFSLLLGQPLHIYTIPSTLVSIIGFCTSPRACLSFYPTLDKQTLESVSTTFLICPLSPRLFNASVSDTHASLTHQLGLFTFTSPLSRLFLLTSHLSPSPLPLAPHTFLSQLGL